MNKQNAQAGYLNPLLIPLVVSIVAILGFGGFGIWSFMNYSDQKNNVDQKLAAASALAKQEQGIEDEKKFAEREKEPTRVFIAPDDLGRIQINFPKTWSSFVGKDGRSGSTYEVYFHPATVPSIESKTPYAARITVEDKTYDSILANYQDLVKKGELKSSPIAVEGLNGNRLDGNFTKEIQGSMVIFKVRDKTLRLYTESNIFKPDFDNIILKSLKFNP